MAAREASGDSFIDAGTNPGTFSKYLPSEQGSELRLFFANYYFNKDFAEKREALYTSVIEEMSTYYYALYNLALTDVLEKDQVSFYFIGSRYLVPASVIIKSAQTRKSGISFKVR